MTRRSAVPASKHTTGRQFQLLLPLIMSGIHLGLLASSLILHHEPWVVYPPPEFQPENQAECSGENCAVAFAPAHETRAGRILKTAELLNLPAVFLGAVLHLVAVLIHVPHPPGEPTLLGFSTVFVPLIWYRIGRWVDLQASGGNVHESSVPQIKSAWTMVTRAIAWCSFVLVFWSFLVERHREPDATKFVMATAILWTGAYLGVGLFGDHRRAAQLRSSVV